MEKCLLKFIFLPVAFILILGVPPLNRANTMRGICIKRYAL